MFSRLSNLTLITVFIIAPAIAQEAPEIRQTYVKLCGGCHGDDARGTQQGPGLAGNPSLRRRSTQSIRNVIRNGIPAAGMPGFDLPAATLDALANLVASLNASAADTAVPGDRAAGKQFFFGTGNCGSCHMVYGEGSPIGPDLSNIAREMTVDQLREALLQPDARIAPGYGVVNARLRDGRTLRGFARSKTSFDLALQDLKGGLHPLSLDRISNITDETRSLMPPVKAGELELQNLLAFLSRLTGVQPGTPTPKPLHQPGRNRFRKNPKPQARRLADLQRQPERQSIQPSQTNQRRQCKQARAEVDLLDSAMDAVPAGHSLLSREHAVLRIGNRSDRGRRHHVRHRTESGVCARCAHGQSNLALLATRELPAWCLTRR